MNGSGGTHRDLHNLSKISFLSFISKFWKISQMKFLQKPPSPFLSFIDNNEISAKIFAFLRFSKKLNFHREQILNWKYIESKYKWLNLGIEYFEIYQFRISYIIARELNGGMQNYLDWVILYLNILYCNFYNQFEVSSQHSVMAWSRFGFERDRVSERPTSSLRLGMMNPNFRKISK